MNSQPSAITFEALGLGAALRNAVQQAGFQRPTPVQAAVIAAILAGRDVVARAATGSGKTAAFGLPLLQALLDQPRSRQLRGNQVSMLVLAPTRELVLQISTMLGGFVHGLGAPHNRLTVIAAYGGVAINPQQMSLRGGVDILVATPGRLLDLQRQNAVRFEQLRCVVLDEADRLLSPGFSEELDELLSLLPVRRQNLLFSATFSEDFAALARARLHEPLEVAIEPAEPNASLASTEPEPAIEQHVYRVDADRKGALLIHLVQARDLRQVLVFVSMKKTGNKLVAELERAGIQAAVFHADKSQRERFRCLNEFRTGRLHILVATDLAARGLDIDDLPVVINVELPRSPNDYIHRIGRTGRAGKTGLAISLIERGEEAHFRVIEKRLKRRLVREQLSGFEPRDSKSTSPSHRTSR